MLAVLERFLRRPDPAEPLNIALLVGCPRSGTSICGELIAAHPGIRYFFERSRLWEAGKIARYPDHRLSKSHASSRRIRFLRKYFHRAADLAAPGTLLLEKNPRNSLRVPFLREVFPEARIIHIVRDGRDAACSLLPGLDPTWRHAKPSNWKSLRAEPDALVRCALAWQSIVETALADLEATPHLLVRYEDLVQDPCAQADRILAYLDLPKSPEVRAFAETKIQNETENSYHAAHQVRWFQPNHRTRIARWRTNAPEHLQEKIQSLLAPTLTRLGYALHEF